MTKFGLTLADLLKEAGWTYRDQSDEGHTDERNIVRPTAEEQAVKARMAKARAAKASKPAKAKAAATKAADTVNLPDHPILRRVFLTLLMLAQEQVEAGTSPVVPHWKVLSETKGEEFGSQPDSDEPYTARFILQDLERDGYVRQIVTRKGTLCWIPTLLDSDGAGRGARSAKGGRTSDIRRKVDALENRYLSRK